MKIIIAGGSGYIGTYLAQYFASKNNDIIILSRSHHNNTPKITYCVWDGKNTGDWQAELNGADILINLTGKSVNCRYTDNNKKEILDSRIDAVTILGETIKSLTRPPKIWFNAASATVYRHAEDKPQDEISGEIGDDFSMNICKAWEKSFYTQQLPETRKIVLRMAITLGNGDGVTSRIKKLIRFGLGGKMGNGKQMMSWVHIEDVARSIEFLYEHQQLNGIFNIASPNPITNDEFMRVFRKKMHVPFGIPTPKWLLKIGSKLIGTETELILKSRWVIPKKLLESGFDFKYSEIAQVLNEV